MMRERAQIIVERGIDMDFTGRMILSYLEEDDERRILFRVRPLLSAQGAVAQEEIEDLEQEGYLRIAPDKQEQHTFKDRMRGIGRLCLMDLRDSASAMGKIRPNKNFAPSRGENNRYIIYSDAVKALPADLVYEVVSEDRGTAPLTQQFFVRSGGRISGPRCVSGAQSCPEAHSLPPDCDRLFLVEMPDGSSRMFYWPEQTENLQEAAPAAEYEVETVKEPARETLGQEPSVQDFALAASGVHQALTEAGFDLTVRRAAQLLLLCLLSPRLQLSGECLADARLAENLLSALLLNAEKGRQNGGDPEQGSPARLLCSQGSRIPQEQAQEYMVQPWPVFHLQSGAGWPGPAGGQRAAVNTVRLYQRLEAASQQIALKTRLQMDALTGMTTGKGFQLPLLVRQSMVRFVSLASCIFENGQEEALQGAVDAWALPWLRFCGMGEDDLAEIMKR